MSDAERELKRLRHQQAKLQREEQRLIDAYQIGAIEVDELKERRQRLGDLEHRSPNRNSSSPHKSPRSTMRASGRSRLQRSASASRTSWRPQHLKLVSVCCDWSWNGSS